MIVFTGEDVEYSNRDAKRYDGVYYALILNSVLSSDGINYLCYVYIPEIFGDVDNSKGRLYYRCYDYVRVLVPDVSDDCDISDEDKERNKPSTGKIIKVAFDDGNINSCRYISSIPIDELYEKMNYNYVTEGILPTDIIDNITDENILETLRPLIEVGYFITTGHKGTENDPIPADCYKFKFLWSNTKNASMSTFRNWFIEALTMPLQSYGGKDTQFAEVFYPYYSTNIYNLYFVIKKVIDNGDYDKLAGIFSNLLTEENGISGFSDLFFSFNTENSSTFTPQDKAKTSALWILGLFTGITESASENDVALANILYSNITKEYITPSLVCGTGMIGYDCSAEYLWKLESYYTPFLEADKEALKKLDSYRFHNILNDSKIKTEYETHYVSVLSSWTSGINNLTKDEKFRNIILMCLTIAPWFASPLLLYTTQDKDLIVSMLKFRDAVRNSEGSKLDEIYNNFVEDNIGNIEYSSVFPNKTAYLDFGVDMQSAIKSGEKEVFIDRFEGYVEDYLCKVYNNNGAYYDKEACVSKKQMNAKFDRLRDRAKTEGWLS